MRPIRVPAAFYRGGSSKAVIFKASDLPSDPKQQDAILLHVLGSPDTYQRQLNGLGGGLSSVSKAVIIAPSKRDDADIDYTFAQVSVNKSIVDYGAMCGNISSCVGPFAIEEGLLSVGDGLASVRIFNTNTQKIFEAEFTVQEGIAIEEGDFSIAGTDAIGAKVALRYFDPAATVTPALLPSGNTIDTLYPIGFAPIDASLVDSSNPVIFVRADDLNIPINSSPESIETIPNIMSNLDQIRRAGAVIMGLADTPENAQLANPKIAIVGAASSFTSLNGEHFHADSHDISIRIVSMGKVHRAVTLTGAMCLAAACNIPNSIPNEITPASNNFMIGNPSGLLPVDIKTQQQDKQISILSTTSYRTQRRIMEGSVLIPAKLLSIASH
jgi:2-methylaconitate cis-trans-isomerase PrpF